MYTSKVTDNNADRGGGVFFSGGTHELEAVNLRRNNAHTEGGGARIAVGTTLTMMYGAVTANNAGTLGGGFAVPGGVAKLFAIDIRSNSATTDGGGIAIANVGRVEATDVWLHENTAGARGGAIAVLAYAENTDPQLAMIGLFEPLEEACTYRGPIGKNEYCSDIKANVANQAGGVYLEDGTETSGRSR